MTGNVKMLNNGISCLPLLLLIIFLKSFCYSASTEPSEMIFEYPIARRDDKVVDDYFGTKISDPYRWLEDPDSEETKQFIEIENAITRSYLDKCESKADINARLTQLWNYPIYTCPARRGKRYFFFKNTGLQNQSVLYVQETLESEPKIFIDPNALSEDGTVALSNTKFSKDGETFAYGLSASGSDWITIHFKDVATGKDYPEILENVKFTLMSWSKDNKGFFYSRYPDQTRRIDGSVTNLDRDKKLYYHRLNTPQSEDVLIVEFPEEPLWTIIAQVSDCGQYLIISVIKELADNLIFFARLKDVPEINSKLPLIQIVHKFEANYVYVSNEGSICIFRTNKNAPNYHLITIDLENPAEENWNILVPEHPTKVLDWAEAVNKNQIVLHYLQDVKSVLQLHNTNDGSLIKTFPLDVGTVDGFCGAKNQSEIFYQFTSFLTPGIIYRCDLSKEDYTPTVFKEVHVPNFDPTQYEARQVFYSSKDGTKIPMFIVSKKSLPRDGTNPTLVYGYGGFRINELPQFNVKHLAFIQHLNGVLAIPNIRGGGEYGDRWYNGGRLLNKQNVFHDFQWAAQYLIENDYTNPSLITIEGASNGGLLVAACINQRPELYGAAIVDVGVLDMLRFHMFTIGHTWVSDFGNPNEKIHFENLLKYSPLHNIRPPDNGTRQQYPATLILTADHDDRVVPLHSLKFTAALQHALSGNDFQHRPVLAKIETKAGHGGGKPTSKIIEERTDILCFMVESLGLNFMK